MACGGAIAPGSGAEVPAGTAGEETSVGEGQGRPWWRVLVKALSLKAMVPRPAPRGELGSRVKTISFSGLLLTWCQHFFQSRIWGPRICMA